MLPPVPTGFSAPDDARPVLPERVIQSTPDGASVRGMFFNSYVEQAKERGIRLDDVGAHAGFKYYPAREWQRFIVQVAQKFHPDLPLGGALRRVGLSAYPTFAESMVGRVVFGVLGKDLARIMRVAQKGFEHSLSSARVELLSADDHSARLYLAGVYGFFDTYTVGVFEGAIRVCEREGDVHVRLIGHGEGEIFVRWT
jgi:uncharacterized protein (TIGR02265 family)